MAVLLRFLHSPSLTHNFPTEPQQLTRTPLSNLSTYNYKHNLSHSVSIKTKRLSNSNFVLRFSSSTTQEQAQAPSSSSSPNVSTETQVLGQETEEFSRDRLIAQNVPWSCTAEDVRTLFEKHGTVLDVELSMHNKVKNRGLAFVTMGSPEEALTALNNLDSYKAIGVRGPHFKDQLCQGTKEETFPPPVQPKPLTFNLFVANLPFEARSKDLREFFGSENSSLVSAQVIFHENPRKSSGYGFVAFKYKKDADEALSSFQGKIFMGRPIRIARSRQFVKLRAEENAESGDTSTTEESAESGDTSTELNSSVEQADTADENGK
ncbi:28 kda ribonucleoprotein [Quercus suber]|uniref:28 kDa ribonucleoprotein n=1 Tax=Quercus suber TaxID=58331 RepID=A0AAW0LQV2_QUESU